MSTAAVTTPKDTRGPIPRGARRRAQIAEAAERVFLLHGFADTTMQMVALAAGASKETLYRHFGSKEDLFIEVVSSRNNQARSALDAELRSDRPVQVILRTVGISLLECMCSPPVAALARIIVHETLRHPALGDAFFEMAPGRTLQNLTRFLTEAKDRGEFVGDDPRVAAEIFIGSVIGKVVPSMLFTPHRFAIERGRIEAHVNEAVRAFSKSYGAGH